MQNQEGLLLPESHEPPFDLEVFDSFTAAHLDKTDIYEQLTPDKERKAAGLNALRNGEEADFSVQDNSSGLTHEVIAERLQVLEIWKRDLIVDRWTDDTEIKQMYRWKVNEDIANLHMLEASLNGDMERFRRWNTFIYGEPDENVYRAALDWIASDAEQILTHADQPDSVKQAAQNVLTMLDGERGSQELLIPDAETFNAVREDHMREKGYYGLLLAGVDMPQSGKIASEEGDGMLLYILRNNLLSDYDLEDAPGSSWSVVHGRRAVRRPKTYNMVAKRFMGLATGHEIGSHLLEYVNGMRGPVRLLSRGLDRTERTSEGRAIVREIVPYESFDEFGKLVRWRDILRRHIAIGHAWGIGQDQPRTSQQVYQFMKTIDTMYQSKLTPDDPALTEEKAHIKTGNLLADRILRGVDGRLGGAYLKDKVYAEGHVAVWLDAALHGPQNITNGDRGKHDITNPRHVEFLQNRGILPKV